VPPLGPAPWSRAKHPPRQLLAAVTLQLVHTDGWPGQGLREVPALPLRLTRQ
jgi:hypothetical protein